MALERARDPIGEIAIGGAGAAAPLEAVTSLRKAEGQDESGTSSAEETPQPAGPTGAKKLRVNAPTRGSYTRGSLKTISEIQESGSLGLAIEGYEGAKTAATSGGSHASRLKWRRPTSAQR